jgi:putative peptide zinc metalloprotease protein
MKFLPSIREDLKLIPTSCAEDGSKQWLIFDAVQNKYFTIGIDTFYILSHWKANIQIEKFLNIMKKNNLNIDEHSLNIFLDFLYKNSLIKIENKNQKSDIYKQYIKNKKSLLTWIIHNYLFIRIPIIQPNKWLTKNISKINFMYTNAYKNFIILLGFFGTLLVLRDFDKFISTFDYFYNTQGVVYYILSLIFVKSIHELGHAFTAKKYGCKVPNMGIALLVLMPVLYTDTTDSWKLANKNQRLNIILAGVKTEVYLACITLFLWSFLPDGVLKSIAFTIATTSLITSILINISPFLRFDGYYALSDFTNTKNLQPRSFAMAKWFIRKELIGLNETKPEFLTTSKENFFITYALSTWIYRFFLFLGIAVLIYYFAFKVLGIILFIIEIFYFILIPILTELKVWWLKKEHIKMNLKIVRTLFILSAIVIFLVYPWQTKIYLPAVIESKNHIEIYAPKKSQIDKILVKNDQQVNKGDKILILKSKELEQKIEELKINIELLELKINTINNNKNILETNIILQDELSKKRFELYSLNESQKNLILTANFDGIIKIENIYENMWVNQDSKLFEIFNPNTPIITAFCTKHDKQLINNQNNAVFIANNNTDKIEATINNISNISTLKIEYEELTSKFNGDIAVVEKEKDLISNNTYFKVYLNTNINNIQNRQKGVVIIDSEPSNIINRFYLKVLSILIRESGF